MKEERSERVLKKGDEEEWNGCIDGWMIEQKTLAGYGWLEGQTRESHTVVCFVL